MNYINVANKFFEDTSKRDMDKLFENLYLLVRSLKDVGFDRKNIDQKLIDIITNNTLPEKASEFMRAKFGYYIIYYLKYIVDFDYSVPKQDVQQESVITTSEQEDVSSDILSNLKPSDFKTKEYDAEFLKMIGVEEGDLNV